MLPETSRITRMFLFKTSAWAKREKLTIKNAANPARIIRFLIKNMATSPITPFYPVIVPQNMGLCQLTALIYQYRESLKTSVFRDLPLKNARFAAQRARNCKGTSENNRFSEVPYNY
jgi:hypothetical protein